jgi:acylphosphatase
MAASDSIHEETGETSATPASGEAAAPAAPPETAPEGEGRRGEEPARLTIWVRGEVQGVGFRWFTRAAALRIGGLVGFALNLDDGRVQIVGEGARAHCEQLLEWLRGGDTPGHVEGVTEIWDEPRGGYRGFAIR